MSDHASLKRTTVRRLTAAVSSAIATIAIEGPHAADILSHALVGVSGLPVPLDKPRARFARWRFADPQLADEHVVVLVRSPTLIELHCHGGMAITEQIMSQLQASGGDLAESGFLQALLEESAIDKLDAAVSDEAIQTEAHRALIRSTTLNTSIVLLDQFQGALAREFGLLREMVANQHCTKALELCDTLLQRSEFGTRLLAPWRLTLAGPPNVGKSSLMNALCGVARVLVHFEPGTTRDAIETELVIGGWPLILTDTAGIRDSAHAIEQQGIEAAWLRWLNADVGLLVVDATVGWTAQHSQLLSGPSVIIVVVNKIDAFVDADAGRRLVQAIQQEIGTRVPIITASAKSDDGIATIVQTVDSYLNRLRPPSSSGVPFTSEQVQWLADLRRRLDNTEGRSAHIS